MSNLRRHPRKPLNVDFRCHEETGSGQLSFDTGDLSAGGAFIKSDLLFEQGEPLQVEFSLPGRELPLKVDARVAWVRRFPQGDQLAGMGVAFDSMSREDRRALEAFLES